MLGIIGNRLKDFSCMRPSSSSSTFVSPTSGTPFPLES